MSITASIQGEYLRYKKLAEAAIAQVPDDKLAAMASDQSNSIVVICWHVSGNLQSRFTDFLTADGEKPWRDRESEFVPRNAARAELMAPWDDAWSVLFTALSTLEDDALGRTVTIRGEPHSVLQALHRSLAHASYHVGQIVQLAKSYRGADWQSLSIPKGGTRTTPTGKHSLSEGDGRFRDDFEAGVIAPAQFNHRAHVRLAYTYLAGSDTETAASHMRAALLAFLRRHAIDPARYHETMTRAWILAVRHFMETSASTSADDFIARNPVLLDTKIMMTHYSAGLLFSPEARARFVEPDLDAIPGHEPTGET